MTEDLRERAAAIIYRHCGGGRGDTWDAAGELIALIRPAVLRECADTCEAIARGCKSETKATLDLIAAEFRAEAERPQAPTEEAAT